MAGSKNIIGENFSPDLIQQINIRQEKLGNSTLKSEEIVMSNSKTAWLRVTSGVKLKGGTNSMEKAGLGNFVNTGGPLAEEFVLFGGVISNRGKEDITDLSPSPLDIPASVNSNYGIGDNTQWGYSPPPAITSMEIQAINRGAVRKAQLMITAHNPDQFKIIETLFLRLGFTTLVEWGHSIYYDTNKDIQNMDFGTVPFRNFLDANGGAYEKLNELNKTIVEERKKYHYNYDAFVGFITNFTWSIGPEGVYNINLTILSPGALIESLTISKSTDEKISQQEENPSGNIIEAWLNYWKEVLDAVDDEKVIRFPEPLPLDVNNALRISVNDNESPPIPKLNATGEKADEIFGFKFIKEGELLKNSSQGFGENDSPIISDQYYISLGAFLRFIEYHNLYYDRSKTPILGIDSNYQSSFMLSHPYQNSVDPNICMLSSRIVDYEPPFVSPPLEVENNDFPSFTPTQEAQQFAVQDNTAYGSAQVNAAAASLEYSLNNPVLDTTTEEAENQGEVIEEEPINPDDLKTSPDFTPYKPGQANSTSIEATVNAKSSLPINTNIALHFRDTGISSFEGYQGDIMGIMVNFDFLIRLAVNTDLDATLYDFIEAILRNIENSTGGINDFSVSYNEDTRKIQIYDNRTIPGVVPENAKEGSFHVLGFGGYNNTDIGSFVRNFNFQTKVFPSLTNFVAISAHTGEIPLPDEASSFQILNKNLVDRVMGSGAVSPSKGKEGKKNTIQKYYEQIRDLSNYFKRIYYRNQTREVSDYGTILKDILKYDLQLRALNNEMISPFFIPIDLSITIDGLSGMTLWQKFGITPDYILPPDYPNNLDFIIQGISHTVKDNEWTTTLNTLSWPSPNKSTIQVDPAILKGGTDDSTNIAPNPDEGIIAGDWEIITNGGEPEIKNKKGELVTPRKAVNVLHPEVRETFVMVFEDWLKLPQLKGYTIKIISEYRTWKRQQELVNAGDTTTEPGFSPHNWGTGYDIEIHRNGTRVLVKDSSLEKWMATGMVEVARRYNLRWGGVDFGDYHDPVHFDVGIDKEKTRDNAIEYYRSTYIRVPSNSDLAKLTKEEIYNNINLVFT